jgi:mgtE-like transporter
MLNMAAAPEEANSARATYGKFLSRVARILHLEPTLLVQSFGVLLVCALIDLLPGYFLGVLERYLILVPGLLVLLPPTVGLRGNTFGALASRLSSKLHLGTLSSSISGNRELKDQIIATSIQLMVISTIIPFVGSLVSMIFGMEVAPISILLFISITSGIISGILMLVISLGITFIAFRKGWDPDNVSAPIIASSGDILTIPILFLSAWLSIHVSSLLINTFSIAMLILIGLSTLYTLARYRREVREILVGMFPIALAAITISTFSGLVLTASFDTFLKGTVFLLLVPAFNGQGGSIGSILGSRLSSAGYLGQDRITLLPNRTGRSSFVTLWIISLVVFSILALAGAGLATVIGASDSGLVVVAATTLLGASMITFISSAIAYYVTFFSFRIGLDPDNVVIPLLTAIMDVVGSGSMILCLMLVTSIV